jgi:GTP cyclohydrolase I
LYEANTLQDLEALLNLWRRGAAAPFVRKALAKGKTARERPVLRFRMLMKAQTAMKAAEADAGTPVSVKIRERILAARKRFHSNDNIAAFIEAGELEQLLDEVEVKMQAVLDSLVIDTTSDHNTSDTARRVAKMYVNEVFRGRYVQAPRITEFPNVEHLNELMIVGPITVRSACSHHFCPVIGKVWIGVMPNEHTNVIGLSKYARLAEWVMGRPQIQEEAVVQLADLIMEKTQPDGLAIVMEASHYCMAWRGVKDIDAKMLNSVMRGVFLKDSTLRREFLALIPRKD